MKKYFSLIIVALVALSATPQRRVCIDSLGRTVTSDCTTRLKVENIGAGELIGCATGAPDDMESFRSFTPRVFRGRAQAVVRSTGQAGAVDLRVERNY